MRIILQSLIRLPLLLASNSEYGVLVSRLVTLILLAAEHQASNAGDAEAVSSIQNNLGHMKIHNDEEGRGKHH